MISSDSFITTGTVSWLLVHFDCDGASRGDGTDAAHDAAGPAADIGVGGTDGTIVQRQAHAGTDFVDAVYPEVLPGCVRCDRTGEEDRV